MLPGGGDIAVGRPWVSAVVPVFGDNVALAELLRTLRDFADPPDEIVVVDGAASSACRTLTGRYGGIYVGTRAGRGHQLHAGALRASGQVLWFVHADAAPPADAVALIRARCMAGCTGGHFRFRFAGKPTWYKRVLAALINIRARFGVPYGDQGLFATRVAYDAVGGFTSAPLFEEVPLVRGLRRLGPFVRLPAAIGVSPRRWERDGWIWRTVENRTLALAYLAGVPAERLAPRYRPLGPEDPGGQVPEDNDPCS